MKTEAKKVTKAESPVAPHFGIDLTDAESARQAFIASEIFNRKY